MPSFARISVPILTCFFLQGCLSTWIRMEDGTVLAPGRSDFTLAVGSVPRPAYSCPGNGWSTTTSDGSHVCEEGGYGYTWNPNSGYTWNPPSVTPATLVIKREQHFGMGWRLGALGPFGPFTGLELGIQTEAATNPITQEYKLALGLPGSDSTVAHSLIAGWGIGMWSDNEWFLQYAASRRFGNWRFFGSFRTTLQATQYQNIFDSDKFEHKRTWDYQLAAGTNVRLGEIMVVPDWLSLGVTADLTHVGYPSLDGSNDGQKSGLGLAWAMGMGWTW